MPFNRRRNRSRWVKKHLLKQLPEYMGTGELGLAKKAVKTYIGKKFGNCHQLVHAKDIAIFIRSNPNIGPYNAIEAFSRFLVEAPELIVAGNELGLDQHKVFTAIDRGQNKK